MPKFKVLLASTQWHSKIIDADTKEQAQDIAFESVFDLSQWDYECLGNYENYDTIKLNDDGLGNIEIYGTLKLEDTKC